MFGANQFMPARRFLSRYFPESTKMSEVEASSPPMVEDTALSATPSTTAPIQNTEVDPETMDFQVASETTSMPNSAALSDFASQPITTSIRGITNISSISPTSNLPDSEVICTLHRSEYSCPLETATW